jgi:hypothetical protein
VYILVHKDYFTNCGAHIYIRVTSILFVVISMICCPMLWTPHRALDFTSHFLFLDLDCSLEVESEKYAADAEDKNLLVVVEGDEGCSEGASGADDESRCLVPVGTGTSHVDAAAAVDSVVGTDCHNDDAVGYHATAPYPLEQGEVQLSVVDDEPYYSFHNVLVVVVVAVGVEATFAVAAAEGWNELVVSVQPAAISIFAKMI